MVNVCEVNCIPNQIAPAQNFYTANRRHSILAHYKMIFFLIYFIYTPIVSVLCHKNRNLTYLIYLTINKISGRSVMSKDNTKYNT